MKMKNKAFIASAEKTTGYVTDVDKKTVRTRTSSGGRRRRTKYTAYVKYTVKGVDYTTSFSTGASTMDVGEAVYVYYKASNPNEAITNMKENNTGTFAYLLIVGLGVFQFIQGKKEENNYTALD